MSEARARKGKVWSLCFAALLVGAASAAAAQYTDVPAGAWYADAVSKLTEDGIVSGYDAGGGLRRFDPARQVTRAEFLKMCLVGLLDDGLRQSLSLYGLLTVSPFPDVPADQWPAPYVAFAKAWNIVTPFASSFSPNSAITRTDAVAMIYQTMELSGSLVEVRGDRIFTDVGPQDVHIHEAYMAGIVEGYSDGSFRPAALLSRAEAAVLLARARRRSIDELDFGLKIKAQTPVTPHFPARSASATRDTVGIRVNRPDNPNNLIQVHLEAHPIVTDSRVEYVLRRSGPDIRVWPNREKSSPAWLDDADQRQIDESALTNGIDIFVESTAPGSADLVLEVRKLFDGKVLGSAAIRLKAFASLVVVLGGEFQHPEKYEPSNGALCSSTGCGIFDLGYFLYSDGYDAMIFDEDDVEDLSGKGRVFDSIKDAVENRGVNDIAIIGYSHGGGATFFLSVALFSQNLGGTFSLAFTAYVDAVRSGTLVPEIYRPILSQYHLNIFQAHLPLHGAETLTLSAQFTENVPVNDKNWGTDLAHTSIDDDPNVAAEIVNALRKHVKNP